MAELKGRGRYLALTLLLVLALLIFWQVSLNVGFLPARSEQTILLFVLSTLVSLTFLVFAFILTRNVFKLYLERRANLLGSKFKTKLVIGALALSLFPVCALFYWSYVLTNRTLSRWFTQPFASLTRQTRALVDGVLDYANRETISDASAVATGPIGDALRARRTEEIGAILEHEAGREGLDFLAVDVNGGNIGAYSNRGQGSAAEILHHLALTDRRTRRALGLRLTLAAGSDYSVAIVPVDPQRVPNPSGWIIAANRLPDGINKRLSEIDQEERNYNQLAQSNKRLRTIFLLNMALVTILLLFASTWVALFLSKQVTVPIQALAEATNQVSMGNLEHRVKVKATDELGVLVKSFNDMISQLEESTTELDRRRRETETMLESLPTPVISLSRDRRILRINSSVERMFGPERAAAPTLRELVGPDEVRDIDHLLRRAIRQGSATTQIEVITSKGKATVAMTVSALRGGQRIASDIAYIVVLEDLSDLLHAQQSEAWQEVARRVAHEIKNPLTPIALSAERIRRRIDQIPEEQRDEALKMIAESAGLIEQEVGTLKALVDEFSQMARFPKALLERGNLNPIVENAVAVFDGRLDGIQLRLDLAADLPDVQLDPEQMKRVIVNLVDNAAEAMEPCLFKELHISTARVGGAGEFVEVSVADTGPGVSPELKAKLFLPYFSTKKRGTGLGLSIASRIIAEHGGTMRVEENDPVGARFILEIPV